MNEKKEPLNGFCCQAVIFDMDGTLVDSTHADFLAWRRLFAEYQQSLTQAEYLPLMGIRSAEVIRKMLPVKSDEEVQYALSQKLVFFHEIISESGIKAVPYADTFLKRIKTQNIPVALATSSRQAKMQMVMDQLGLLPFFDAIVTAGDVKNGKPAPDIFIRAAEKLKVPFDRCLVFEDAPNGIQAAKSAWMKCVALSTTQPREALKNADLVIDTFKDATLENICFQLSQ